MSAMVDMALAGYSIPSGFGLAGVRPSCDMTGAFFNAKQISSPPTARTTPASSTHSSPSHARPGDSSRVRTRYLRANCLLISYIGEDVEAEVDSHFARALNGPPGQGLDLSAPGVKVKDFSYGLFYPSAAVWPGYMSWPGPSAAPTRPRGAYTSSGYPSSAYEHTPSGQYPACGVDGGVDPWRGHRQALRGLAHDSRFYSAYNSLSASTNGIPAGYEHAWSALYPSSHLPGFPTGHGHHGGYGESWMGSRPADPTSLWM